MITARLSPSEFGVTEDQILMMIDIERALASLHPADALMMRLVFRLDQPEDWTYRWPPRYEDIGCYIGIKFEGEPLSEAAIRYRRDAILGEWRGERGTLRRNRKNSDI